MPSGFLQGRRTGRHHREAAARNSKLSGKRVEAKSGKDIKLTIDITIQSIAGPVTIENSGVARVDAQIGELIKAKNEQSGKIVEGIVVSRKKIRVLTK